MKGFAGTTYDEVPYMAASFPNTHPEILAVTALMRGLEPPSLAGARVLELGCARGANLVPMACSMPEATFVGVDLSQRQIDEARAMAAAVGATNVTLHAMDLCDVDEGFGSFDYVIALSDSMRETCIAIEGPHSTLHWHLPDPGAVPGSLEERLTAYRRVRDELSRRLVPFVELALRTAAPEHLFAT